MFKAQYTQDAPIVYNVKFLDYDDEVIADINATDGSSIGVPTPNRTDYTFTEWQEVGGSETIASGVTTYTVTKDIIFKAQYITTIYIVQFLDDNDTVIEEINATAGTSIDVPDAPVIENYTFTSWIEVGGTERIEASATTYTVTRSVIFKAQYSTITYAATFLEADGIAVINILSGAYGTYIEVPTALDIGGYTFSQWQEVEGDEIIPRFTASYMLTRNVTFRPEYVEGAEIRTQADLNNARNYRTSIYKLMNDIALDSNGPGFDKDGWQPISINTSPNSFKGTFDGNGHKITGLWINRPANEYVGLFGKIGDTTIKNLGVEISGSVYGHQFVGGIAGSLDGGTITNSYVSGSVASTGNSDVGGVVGGIAGYVHGASITNSYSTGSVSSSGHNVGGIAGYLSLSASITNSYSTASVRGNNNNVHIGGIAGAIDRSLTTNNVAINPSVSGGMDVNRVLGHFYSGSISNNFALDTMTVTGKGTGGNNAGTDKTITQLKIQANYANSLGWNFGDNDTNPWKIDPYKNDGLPYLYWENR
jgi:hypothetical protein